MPRRFCSWPWRGRRGTALSQHVLAARQVEAKGKGELRLVEYRRLWQVDIHVSNFWEGECLGRYFNYFQLFLYLPEGRRAQPGREHAGFTHCCLGTRISNACYALLVLSTAKPERSTEAVVYTNDHKFCIRLVSSVRFLSEWLVCIFVGGRQQIRWQFFLAMLTCRHVRCTLFLDWISLFVVLGNFLFHCAGLPSLARPPLRVKTSLTCNFRFVLP